MSTETVKHTITSENISEESYYNLVMLSSITGYADPVQAIIALNREGCKTEWAVNKDACGNIVPA